DRELPSAAHSGATPIVYYDLLGQHMFVYSEPVARRLALCAFLLGCAAIAFAWRRGRLSAARIFRAVGWTSLAVGAGLIVPLVVAAILSFLFQRSMGWYSMPGLAVWAYAPFSLAGVLWVFARLERPSAEDLGEASPPLESWAGALVLQTALLLLL